MWSSDPRVSSRDFFQSVCEVKTVFIIVVRHYFLFHCVCIYTRGLKAKVGKTTSTVVNIKRGATKCTSTHCICHCHTPAVKDKTKGISLNACNEAIIINFIKFQLLSVCLFNILGDQMGSIQEALWPHTRV